MRVKGKGKGKGQLKDALHFSKQGTTPPLSSSSCDYLNVWTHRPLWHKGHLGRKAIGVLIGFGKELNLISEKFIFVALFAGIKMMNAMTLLRYCTPIYPLLLPLFSCLTSSL